MASTLYGVLSLVTGSESFLVEREVGRLVAQAKSERTDVGVRSVSGPELSVGILDEMAGVDLFSAAMVQSITEAEKTPKDVEARLVELATNLPSDIALIIAHHGGNQSRALLEKLRALASTLTDFQPIKPASLAKFVSDEVRRRGASIGAEAAQTLVDAVGQDTRSLAAAITQLLADTEAQVISTSLIKSQFSGRATMSAFAVADDAMAGRVADAIVKLRWALSTGVAHVRITSALAGSLRQVGNYLALSKKRRPTADEVGVPSWKLRDIATLAANWSEQGVAKAICAVSEADAHIKGAAQDPDFALESLIIHLAQCRRS